MIQGLETLMEELDDRGVFHAYDSETKTFIVKGDLPISVEFGGNLVVRGSIVGKNTKVVARDITCEGIENVDLVHAAGTLDIKNGFVVNAVVRATSLSGHGHINEGAVVTIDGEAAFQEARKSSWAQSGATAPIIQADIVRCERACGGAHVEATQFAEIRSVTDSNTVISAGRLEVGKVGAPKGQGSVDGGKPTLKANAGDVDIAGSVYNAIVESVGTTRIGGSAMHVGVKAGGGIEIRGLQTDVHLEPNAELTHTQKLIADRAANKEEVVGVGV